MNNTVELLGFYGSDEVIACSAWTSTSRELTEEKRVRIPALINYLWSNGHETPFEKGTVHFLVDCDIASHIHLLKHRMASINAESARYKELQEDKFYLPRDWNGNNVDFTNFNAYDDLTFKGIETWKQLLESYTEIGNRMYHKNRMYNNYDLTAINRVSEIDEWEIVGNWMWENKEFYNGLSVLPFDGGSYSQAPFENITEQQYYELVGQLTSIDLTQIVEDDDVTSLVDELACQNGACEIL